MSDLERLRELRKKATKGKWHVSDFAIHGEPKAEENATFIAALVNYFDLPSTQAMLDQAESNGFARSLELSLARRDALLLEAVTDRGPNFARRVREELETK